MKKMRLAVLPAAAALGLLASGALGQWSSDSSNNLKVADRGSEQVQPKLAATPDGGSYVSWFDNGVTNYKGDTWAWSGTAWTKVATTGPAPRYRHAMAYDAARQKTVLFGGVDATNSFSDTWEWNGTAWTSTGLTGPSGRSALAMAYDAARGNIVLFGGVDGVGNVNGDTWTFNGTAWTHMTPAGSPSARQGCAMAYDSSRNVVVLFGGLDQSGTALADTWEWNGTTWTQTTPALAPLARSGHGMSFDPVTNQVILFGGDTGVPSQDTWQYDGTNWTNPIPTTLPTARTNCAMAQEFTASGTRVVVFGGFSGSFNVGNMYEWSGTNWATKTTTPNARNGPAMAFHAANNSTVMFGGQDSGGYDVFLQKLNAAGVEQWAHNGVMIADRVVSSTVDYSLACDQDGNAVIVFNDDRQPAQQITLQKVSPTGTLLFGTAGINVGAGSTSSSPPTVAVLADGNYGVIWNTTTSPVSTAMQKVNSATGALLWNGGAPIVQADWLSPARPVQASDCQSDNTGGMIVLFVRCTGTNCVTSAKQLFIQRYNALGAPQWNGGTPITLMTGTNPGVQTGTFPRFLVDGSGGAVVAWYDIATPRNAYIQHVLGTGALKFPAPISNSTNTSTRMRIGASPAYNRATGEYYLASAESNISPQTNFSVIVQKFDPAGNLLWGGSGIELISQSTTFQSSFVQCFPAGDGCVVSWIWQDNTVNGYVYSARVNGDQTIPWNTQVSSQFTTKARMAGAQPACGDYGILAWTNGASGTGDVAVQNVLFDGTLGQGTCPTFQNPPPAGQHPCQGGTLTLTNAASGNPAPCYQWKKNGVALANGGRVSGATSATLTITSVQASDAGSYEAFASNTCGTQGSGTTSVTVCAADFNCDSTLTVADIFDFLAAWFAGNPNADFNRVGGLNVQDIFDFLAAWFAGC